jgi:hypothetical protein
MDYFLVQIQEIPPALIRCILQRTPIIRFAHNLPGVPGGTYLLSDKNIPNGMDLF